ncbi:MAG: InlB B-repeat-containing protein [Paludibacteraceae bacterium]|nr:InlB B-repeat-containing protein [Paludibacteraceae bacterium]
MRTNLVQTLKTSANRINLNRTTLRVALIVLFISLGIGNAWGYSYYSQFTAKSGNTAQGLVYAAGDNSEGDMSDYTDQVTPEKHAKSSSGGEYTWYAWAKAARGYKFKTWTEGSNINSSGSLTSAATTFGVNHSSSDDGTTSGDATATFEGDTPYTITFKKPENFGAYTAEYENYTISSKEFVEYSKTITMTSSSANTNETSYASDKITLKATARVANFIGWYNGSTLLSTSADGYTFSPRAAMTVEGRWEEVVTHLNMTFKAVELDDSDNPKGSYTVGGTTVSTSDVVVNTGDLYYLETTLTATPATGYVFTGWYTKDGKKKNFISYDNPFNAYFDQETTVYASFTYSNYSDDQKAQFKVGSTYYTDLNAANTAAVDGSNKTIVCTRDGVLPPGNYTISSGVSLLIPYSTSETVQTTPAVVTTAVALSANRTLTFTDGANVVCNGEICVGGQIMSAGGGKPSAYPTGACGVIDMSKGGHIELNNKAVLYAWGFVKGQDMDQGNNTLEVGTITANSGAVVWEDFAVGDWRGGSACLTIWNNRSSWKFFPFQSYTVQNVEVPTTYKYGSTLSNYTNVYGNESTNAGKFAIIGKENTLFLLKDSKSLVRKWYDPTTDLVCYEMSGTTQLNALNVDVDITTVNSSEYNLPLSSSMHIILTNCTTTISKPMVMQAGAVVEVKADASLTLSNNVYLFDKDQWGMYCYKKYFYSMTILSIHKDRGTGTSNVGLDDAKLIVDGTLNVTGKLYSTTSGADVMGNGGGSITFSTLPSSGNVVMCTGVSDNENVAVASANLHNEDGSYTKSFASTTFHNINGRWFTQAAATANKADHTYDFTYISSGAVSGTDGTNTPTDAVYSWDKTGLELRQKWFNVTAECNEDGHYWWHGQGDQASWFYNWTLNSDWHQFMPTATEGLYSSSNNTLYTKTSCTWGELGSTDVNCLYEIGGVKKALVDGQFIALEPNNNDPAYHEAEDPTKYYICFEGCNWHAADKYAEAEKAYIIAPDTFIWYNNAWMSVNFQKPFAYTLDETNVPVYYEYVDGEWVLAEPYIRVVDGIEDRSYYFIEDAFKFANSVLRTSPTITILRDISARTAAMSYTAANKTCTLDLNGNKLTLTVVGAGTSAIKMFNINAAGTTFTITDSSEGANGEFRLIAAPNTTTQTKRWYGVYLTNGTLVLNAGKIYAEDNFAYTSTSNAGMVSGVGVAAGMSFTMNDGTIEAYSKYAAYGVDIAGSTSANATVKIKGGTIHAETTQATTAYGMVVAGGTTTITDGKIEARAKTTTAIGVAVTANANGYYGTLKVEGGEIDALTTTTTCYGVQVGEAIVYSSGNIISDRVKSKATISSGTIRATSTTTKSSSHTVGVRSFGTTIIEGGTIECNATQSIAYGVYAVHGTTTIKGTPTIIARAPTNAYGACAGLTPADKTGVPYNGHLEINGGHFEVSATTTTDAYGVLVQALGRAVNYSTKSGYYPGNYVSAGSAVISDGEFDVQAHTTTAYGIFVKGAVTQTGAKLDADGNLADPVTSDSPTCTVTGGKFKTSGTGSVYATNDAGNATTYHINGGYYSHDGNLATYVPSPKHVLTLASDDANRPPYYYKVAEAYLVTFKTEDGSANIIDPVYQEVGTQPICSTEPTKASTTTNSFTFDGWATAANGDKVYEKNGLPNVTSAGATYYAHFATTTLKYRVHFDAATNGGECATENIYVNPGTAIGELPTATKYGYAFNGWFSAASGGTQLTASTVINADADYYAQFTANSHTLTWDLAGGTVSTAGKIGSTTWPAKNATGTPSTSVAFGTILTTIPVVTKTGYTFNRWDPVPGSSMPDADVTYTAIWTPKTNTAYTVKHYQQNVGGTYPTDPFETEAFTGTTATSVTPAVKSYDGFVSPAAQTVTIAANGSTVVTYQYARRHYTFTLDAATNGGTSEVPSIEVIHGATIGAVPPDAQKGCNDFTGWYTKPVGGVKITPEFVIEYDMKTLYAQFSDDLRTYPITYSAGAYGTGTVAAGTKTCGEDATLSSSTFTRDGYAQTGWSLTDGGAQAYALGGTYTANAALTLYPVWTLVTYNLTYEGLNGATNSNPTTYTIETATITLADPGTRAGYTFTGWTCGGSPITQIALGSTGDKTITANWSAVTYNLTYEGLNGATNSNPATYTIETATITLANPGTRVGYAFTGWTCGGNPITQIALGSTGDKTITANWEKIGVTILWKSEDGETTLETDEGVEIDATPSFNGETPTKITTVEYTYTFDGWTTEANGGGTYYATDAMPPVSAAATYYAHFAATANVASVKVGSADPSYYTDFATAWSDVNAADGAVTLKLLQDVEGIATSLAYTNAQNCTLDLNNHTLAGTVTKLIDVNASGKTFAIDDSSADKEGLISMIGTGNARRNALYITAGTVHLKNGKIYGKNTSTYNSSSASKVSAAGVEIASGGKFTMDGGTIESESQYKSYALLINKSTSSVVTINDGLIKGHTNKGTTACGIYNSSTKLTINNGHIVGHAWTNTSYGLYNVYGKATINGGSIEATNDTINNKGTTTAYGICTAYSNTTYTGAITIPSTSTVKVYARTNTTTAYAVVIGGASTGSTIAGGTFTAKAGTTTAQGINSAGTITVSGGTFNVHAETTTSTITTWPSGIYATRGTVTVNGNPTFNVTSGASRAYGVFAYGTVGKNGKAKYSGTININGGTFNVTTTATTAYGAYAGLFSRTVNLVLPENATDTIAGTHRMPGIIEITDGTFNVTATNTAYGIVVAAQNSETIGDVTTDRIPTVTVAGGKFNITGTSKTYAVNTSATNTALDVKGGWYNINTNLANYTAPIKSCNYHVLPLTGEDPYKYEVAEAYKVTWDATTNGGSCATPYTVVKKGATIGTLPVATKDNYSFDGWFTTYTTGGTEYTASTIITFALTAYARFTPNTYNITYKDQGDVTFTGNNIASLPATHTYGTATALVDGTKENYTFDGWFTNPECTGSAVTSLGATAYTSDITLYAKWTEAGQTYYYIDPATGSQTSVFSSSTPANPGDYDDEDYTYTFDSWTDNKNGSYTAAYIVKAERFYGNFLDVVEWTDDYLIVNANGLSLPTDKTNWTITKGSDSYTKANRATDRTLQIARHDTHTADDYIVLKVSGANDGVWSRQKYIVPHIYSAENAVLSDTKSYSIVYVNSGTLTVSSNTTVNAIYVAPSAELVVNSGVTLKVDSLMLRTTPWEAAILDNQGTITAGKAYYTRKIADNSKYYQFAIPLVSNVKNVRLSNGAKIAYTTSWMLKSYSEKSRANNGPVNTESQSNWILLSTEEGDEENGKVGGVIAASRGYEMFVTTKYYQEYYFPVTLPASPTTQVGVAYTEPTGKTEQWIAANSGWNALCSPLLGKYVQNFGSNPEDGLKVSELQTDGSYWQHIPETIYPAVPFYYQASKAGTLDFKGSRMVLSAPRRAWNASIPTQWMQLTIENTNGDKLDETNIFVHPEKFVMDYESGYDVAKQSLEGGKALLYSELPCGKLAFAAVPDSLAETRIPLTVYAATEGEYIFSMMENDYLGRLQYVLLHDTQTGLVTDLLESDFAANLTQGTNAGRFYLQCVFAADAPEVTTGVNHIKSEKDKAQKIIYNDKVYIIYQGRVYDMTGRQCELK